MASHPVSGRMCSFRLFAWFPKPFHHDCIGERVDIVCTCDVDVVRTPKRGLVLVCLERYKWTPSNLPGHLEKRKRGQVS